MDASKSAQLAPGGEIAAARARAAAMLVRRDRWRAAEVLPWLAAVCGVLHLSKPNDPWRPDADHDPVRAVA